MAAGPRPEVTDLGQSTAEAFDPTLPAPDQLSGEPTFCAVIDSGLADRERELLYAVADAVGRYEPIRISGSRIQVRWHDGAVVLGGRVRSLPLKIIAERLAQSATGGRSLRPELTADPEVGVAVATALALDPRTNQCPVFVECSLGVVRLSGPVPTAEMATAAGEIARGVPGVAEVRNELVPAAPPAPPTAAREKAKAGATTKPLADTAFTSEPRLEPHSRDQDADRVTRPQGAERVPIAEEE